MILHRSLLVTVLTTSLVIHSMEQAALQQAHLNPKIQQFITDEKKAISQELNTKFLALLQLKNYRKLPGEMRRLIFCKYADNYFSERLKTAQNLPEVYAIEQSIAQANSLDPVTMSLYPGYSSQLQNTGNPFMGIPLNMNALENACKLRRLEILGSIQRTLDTFSQKIYVNAEPGSSGDFDSSFEVRVFGNLNAQGYFGSNALLLILDHITNYQSATLSAHKLGTVISEESFYLLIKLLVENGIDINMQNDGRVTALMRAASLNLVPVVKLLLDYGADATITQKLMGKNHTALDLAYLSHHTNKEIIKLLIDAQQAQGYTCEGRLYETINSASDPD